MADTTKRYAVVTGANKGIGFGICKQLASNGITVLLTARNDNRGLEALEKIKELGLGDRIIFHQLDVASPTSISTLAHFVKTQFGKLDILVNNAGVTGVKVDTDALGDFNFDKIQEGTQVDWNKVTTQTFELSADCLRINYYGAKSMCEALLPFLQLSASPRIVNLTSSVGKLKNLSSNEWAARLLSDADSLSEKKVDIVVNSFLEDFKDGAWEAKGWPTYLAAYSVSKAALNAYTRVLANKYPNILVNCVSPGFVKTDITFNAGHLTIDEGAESAVRLALLPNGGPSGLFFLRKEESQF